MNKLDGCSGDALSRTLYARHDPNIDKVYPILIGTDGSLKITTGFTIAEFDEVNISYTGGNITKVAYTLLGVTQATLTLSYTSGQLTKVVKT